MLNKQIITILNDAFPLFIGTPLTETDEHVSFKPHPDTEVAFDWRNKDELGGLQVTFTRVVGGEKQSQTEVIGCEKLLDMDYKGLAEWVNHKAGMIDW